ncbi:MAG: ABC transporter permease [Methylococcaceae bacterium]|nr:ABC transporter permease [Methylococcaceae bacterium]
MKTLLSLAFHSAWNRKGTLMLMVVSIALSVMLLLGVEQLRAGVRNGFSQSVSGTDLVIGARTSPIQLMLYAVFRLGDATHNMHWSSFEKLAGRPAVAFAIPISLGDSHQGFPVIGTQLSYFEHFRYGDKRVLEFMQGAPFADIFDTVIGAEVAEQLNYSLNTEIILSHGQGVHRLAEHEDKPFRVVGILKRTGTPVDRSIHVSLAAIEAIHLDWQAGAPMPGVSIPAQYVKKFNLQPKEITAVLIGLKSRSGVFQMQRYVNNFQDEPLLAVLPGVALGELWSIVSVVEKTLLAVSALVVTVGLSGLVAVVLAGLGERRRELAVLRSVGAGPLLVFMLLAIEGLLVVLLGALLGTLAVVAASSLAAPFLQAKFGLTVVFSGLTTQTQLLLAAVILAGALVSLIPGYRAYRMSLTDGLMPRL